MQYKENLLNTAMNLKYKIINYFGDYGTANFWSNISNSEIVQDLKFIKNKGFNTILLMLPYKAFKPSFDNFDSKYSDTLDFLMKEAKKNNLYVIFRIGYLWESNFDQDRTLERYIDMYASCKEHRKSKYEDDFISYVNYFYDNYDFEQMMISWEDFFWPIAFYNATRNNDNQENERETIAFVEYLLGKIGEKEKLFVEQRTNGDFNKISYNPKVSYAYYNTYNIQSWEDDFIDQNFGRGIVISKSMLIQKQFVEWLSRMKAELDLNKDNKLIIDQFNIIDNTFSDDDDHEEFNKTKQKLLCDESNFEEIMDFLIPIIKHNILGIGFWSLWSTFAGHIYNGTFKFDAEGWDTNGYINKGTVLLKPQQHISTNLGYVRLDSKKSWNILIKYSAEKDSKVCIKFNDETQTVNFKAGKNNQEIIRYNTKITNRNLLIEPLSSEISISRIDCFNIMHKSILFDEDRKEEFGINKIKELID